MRVNYKLGHQEDLVFKILRYGSDEYQQALLLREEVLRKPFGLAVLPEEIAAEKNHIHIAGYLNNELSATAGLVPEGNVIKMQRVAIKENLQGRGIGSALMAFCEAYAKRHHFEALYCYARETAVSFYLKHHYAIESLSFNEDGIPHQKMKKQLKNLPNK